MSLLKALNFLPRTKKFDVNDARYLCCDVTKWWRCKLFTVRYELNLSVGLSLTRNLAQTQNYSLSCCRLRQFPLLSIQPVLLEGWAGTSWEPSQLHHLLLLHTEYSVSHPRPFSLLSLALSPSHQVSKFQSVRSKMWQHCSFNHV